MPRFSLVALLALALLISGGRAGAQPDEEGGNEAATEPAPAPAARKVAVFDLRPVRSTGQTELSLLAEAVKLSIALRERIGAAIPDITVIGPVELKALLGATYRVATFDCRESPACVQRMMRKLAKAGIARAVLGTYELDSGRVQLTLHGVETKSGAFTKVELLDTARGAALDEEAASAAVRSLVGETAPAPTPEPADDGSDQTDDLGGDMPPPPAPKVPDRIQVLGWARARTAYQLEKRDPDPLAAPYNKVESRNALYLAARYQRAKSFEATASGLLELSLFDDRTSYEATVRELYVGTTRGAFDFRIGNQRIAWGKGDVISPNDVVNPRDLRDPILTDTELRRIPTFVLRADVESGSHALQVIVQPVFIPDRYDVSGTNWSIIQPSTPEPVRGVFKVISGFFDESLNDRSQQLFGQTSLPTLPSGGGRYTYTGHGFDASLYYHFGYASTPQVRINPNFAGAISMIDWRTATPSTIAPVLGLLDMGITPYKATFRRRQHAGFDAVTTVGPFAIKVDAAYENRAVFYQPTIESFVTPQLQGVVSVEYQTGELGKLLLFEGVYTRLMDELPPLGVIGYKRNTAGVAMTARWTFADVIEAELRAVLEIVPSTTVLQPQVSYKAKSNGLTIAVGGLYMSGDPYSLGDYYSRNRSAYGMIKLPF